MHIRPVKSTDIPAMAEAYVETWRDAYRGILPEAYLESMTVAETAKDLAREMGAAGIVSLVAEGGKMAGLIIG